MRNLSRAPFHLDEEVGSDQKRRVRLVRLLPGLRFAGLVNCRARLITSPLLSKFGTCKTVKARFWRWLQG